MEEKSYEERDDVYMTMTTNPRPVNTVSQEIPYSSIKLVKELSRGKYGIAYLAQWSVTARPSSQITLRQVVVKVVNVETEERNTKEAQNALQDLKREAYALARLNAPNIVGLYGYSKLPNNPWKYRLVLEYCSGGSLKDQLSKQPNMPWPTRWQVATDVATGLAYLHKKQVVHRDLAARNVLIDAQGRAKLTDFGLSVTRAYLEVNPDYCATDSKEFPWAWTAPEVLEGTSKKVTYNQDMYSYGMVLWELSNPGKRPYWKEAQNTSFNAWGKISRIIKEGEREQVPNEAPKLWKELIAACWKRNPVERPRALIALGELIVGYINRWQKTPEQSVHEVVYRKQQEELEIIAEQVKAHSVVHVTQMSRSVQHRINQRELTELMKYTTEGHLENVEEHLKLNPTLAIATCDVTDLSGRTFTKITAFQYALWALDVDMCKLILKYLDNKEAAQQFRALETERMDIINAHGAHYSLDDLIKKHNIYIENYKQWSNSQKEKYWCTQIAGAQRMCPAWFIYAMCEPGKDVAWVKRDMSHGFKRVYNMEYGVTWWMTHEYRGGRLGENWGVARGSEPAAIAHFDFAWQKDAQNTQQLKSLADKWLGALKKQLGVGSDMPVTREEYNSIMGDDNAYAQLVGSRANSTSPTLSLHTT